MLSAHKKSVFYLYLANLGTASLLLLPLMKSFESSLGSGKPALPRIEKLAVTLESTETMSHQAARAPPRSLSGRDALTT